MIDYNIHCPKCFKKVVWKFFYPNTQTEYCCHACGNCWRKSVEETQSQYGIFLGPWGGQEMTQFEENLSSSINPNFDWFFFKGRKIFTAWQKSIPQCFIITHSLDELVYWVLLSTREKGWYEIYRCRERVVLASKSSQF